MSWSGVSAHGKRALLEANLTEETYERHQRQSEHEIRILTSSASVEWYTPAEYIDAVRQVLGTIDVDPASSAQANTTVQATAYFDAEADGLQHDWPGKVFMNPPYSGKAGAFVSHLLDQFARGITTEAIALLNGNSMDTSWFRPLFDFLICFAGRLSFSSPDGPGPGASYGSIFVYLGSRRERFVEVFSGFGPVVKRIDRK